MNPLIKTKRKFMIKCFEIVVKKAEDGNKTFTISKDKEAITIWKLGEYPQIFLIKRKTIRKWDRKCYSLLCAAALSSSLEVEKFIHPRYRSYWNAYFDITAT